MQALVPSVQLKLAQFFFCVSVQVCARLHACHCVYLIVLHVDAALYTLLVVICHGIPGPPTLCRKPWWVYKIYNSIEKCVWSTNLVPRTAWGCQTSVAWRVHGTPWCVCMVWWSAAETPHTSPHGSESCWPSPLPAKFINEWSTVYTYTCVTTYLQYTTYQLQAHVQPLISSMSNYLWCKASFSASDGFHLETIACNEVKSCME